jgi:hypothetical protein
VNFFNEILNDIRKIDRTPSVLRKFGFLLAAVLFFLALMIWFKHRHEAEAPISAFVFSALACISLALSIARPMILLPVNTIMMIVSMCIGWITTRIILLVMFLIVFFPISMLLRLMGRDSLNRQFDNNVPSYWIARKHQQFDPERCKRLF